MHGNTFFDSQDTQDTRSSSSFDWQKYQREYRRRNPERVQQWYTTQAINKLRKLGYTVTEPKNSEETVG